MTYAMLYVYIEFYLTLLLFICRYNFSISFLEYFEKVNPATAVARWFAKKYRARFEHEALAGRHMCRSDEPTLMKPIVMNCRLANIERFTVAGELVDRACRASATNNEIATFRWISLIINISHISLYRVLELARMLTYRLIKCYLVF